jgi:hypothetical protein
MFGTSKRCDLTVESIGMKEEPSVTALPYWYTATFLKSPAFTMLTPAASIYLRNAALIRFSVSPWIFDPPRLAHSVSQYACRTPAGMHESPLVPAPETAEAWRRPVRL